MKKNPSKEQLSVQDVSAANHVAIHRNSLPQIKGGIVVEDVHGF